MVHLVYIIPLAAIAPQAIKATLALLPVKLTQGKDITGSLYAIHLIALGQDFQPET